MTSQFMPPPGWYPDPQIPGQARYFDGMAWTVHTAPQGQVTTAPSIGSSPSDAVHWMVPLGRSWQSIVAGYLGLFCIIIVPGPLAIGFGVWALVVSKKTGAHGRGRAIFGIVAGTLATAFLLSLIFV